MVEPNYIQDFLRRARQQNPIFPSTDIPVPPSLTVPQVIRDRNIQYPRPVKPLAVNEDLYNQPPTQAYTEQVPAPTADQRLSMIAAQDPSTGLMRFGAPDRFVPDSAEVALEKQRADALLQGTAMPADLNIPVDYDRYNLDFDYDPNKFTSDTVTEAEVDMVANKAQEVANSSYTKIQAFIKTVEDAKKLPKVQLTEGGFIPKGQNDLYNLQNTSVEDLRLYANSILYDENIKAGEPLDKMSQLGKALYDQENISDMEDVNRISETFKYNSGVIKGLLHPTITPWESFEMGYWDLALYAVVDFAAAKVLAKTYGGGTVSAFGISTPKIGIQPAASAIAKTNAYQAVTNQTTKVIDSVIPQAVKSAFGSAMNKAKGLKAPALEFQGSQFKYWAGGTPSYLGTEAAVKTQTDNPWLIYPTSIIAAGGIPAAVPKVKDIATTGLLKTGGLAKTAGKTVGESAWRNVLKLKKLDADIGITPSVDETQGFTPFFNKAAKETISKENNKLITGNASEKIQAEKNINKILQPAINDLKEKSTELGLDEAIQPKPNMGLYGGYAEHSIEMVVPSNLNDLDQILFLAADRAKAYNQDSTLIILEGLDANSALVKSTARMFPDLLGGKEFVNSPIMKIDFDKALTAQEITNLQKTLANQSPVSINKITGEANDRIISGLKLSSDKKSVTIAFVDEFLPENTSITRALNDFKQFGKQLATDPDGAGLPILTRLGGRVKFSSGVVRSVVREEYDSVGNRFLNTNRGKQYLNRTSAKRTKQLLDDYEVDYKWFEPQPAFAGTDPVNDPYIRIGQAFSESAKNKNVISDDTSPILKWAKNFVHNPPPTKDGQPSGTHISRAFVHFMQRMWDNTYLLRRVGGQWGQKSYEEIEDMIVSFGGVSAQINTRMKSVLKELSQIAPDLDVTDLDLLMRMELTLNLARQWTRINPQTMLPQGQMKKLPIPIDEILGKKTNKVTYGDVVDNVELIREELVKKYGTTAYKKLKQQVKVINNVYRHERKRLYEEGFLTKEQYEGLNRNYPDYVPTKFINQMADNVSGNWANRTDYKIVREFNEFGDRDTTMPFLETMQMQLATNEYRIKQNKLLKTVLTLLNSSEYKKVYTDSALAKKLSVPRDFIAVEEIDIGMYNKLFPKKEAIAFYHNGKPQYFKVSKELYSELIGFKNELAIFREDYVPSLISGSNTMFKLAHTGSVEFASKNLIIDSLSATITSSKGTIPRLLRIVFRDAMNKLGKADLENEILKDIYDLSGASQKRYTEDLGQDVFLKTAQENGLNIKVGGALGEFKLSKQAMKDAKKNGATFIEFNKKGDLLDENGNPLLTESVKYKLFGDLYDKYQVDPKTKLDALKTMKGVKLFSNALSKYTSVSEYTEQIARRAVFESELKKQIKLNPELKKAFEIAKTPLPKSAKPKMTVEEKITLAAAKRNQNKAIREIVRGEGAAKAATRSVQATIDFSRGGQWIKKANMYIPFLNAAFEASKLSIRTLFTQRQGKKAAFAKIGGLLSAKIALDAYNMSHPEYWDIDPSQRHTSIFFMLPSTEPKQPIEKKADGTDRLKPNTFQVVPRTREWAWIFGSHTKIMEELWRTDDEIEGQPFSEFLFNDIIPEMSPVNFSGRNFSWEGTIARFFPPLLVNPVEQIFNKNFHFDTPLVDKNVPTEEQYNSGTNLTYRAIANTLNIPVSPERLKHSVRTFTGTLGEELVTGFPDWLIENYFLEYVIEPEVIEPYKTILAMKDPDKQQAVLSNLSPEIREKVLIELRRRNVRLPVLNKFSETFYSTASASGAEREIFPAVSKDLGIDMAQQKEYDDSIRIHIENVQRQGHELAEQLESGKLTPAEYRDQYADLYKAFEVTQQNKLTELGIDSKVFQTLTQEEQNEYWNRVNEAMKARGLTDPAEYLYQQYMSIRVDEEMMSINEDLAFEEFFAKRDSFLSSLTPEEKESVITKRNSRINKVRSEYERDRDKLSILWDWTSRTSITTALETGQEKAFDSNVKSEKDLTTVKLTPQRRKIFEDYLMYLNLTKTNQAAYYSEDVIRAIQEEHAKQGKEYNSTLTNQGGRTAPVSHFNWINSVRVMETEKNSYKTSLLYNNPNLDNIYSKWFDKQPLTWAQVKRNTNITIPYNFRNNLNAAVHESSQEIREKYYPMAFQKGLD